MIFYQWCIKKSIKCCAKNVRNCLSLSRGVCALPIPYAFAGRRMPRTKNSPKPTAEAVGFGELVHLLYFRRRPVSSAMVLPPWSCFVPLMTVMGTRSSFSFCTSAG